MLQDPDEVQDAADALAETLELMMDECPVVGWPPLAAEVCSAHATAMIERVIHTCDCRLHRSCMFRMSLGSLTWIQGLGTLKQPCIQVHPIDCSIMIFTTAAAN